MRPMGSAGGDCIWFWLFCRICGQLRADLGLSVIVAPERVSPNGGSPAARTETYRKVEETE
jgi:hypothetical protein